MPRDRSLGEIRGIQPNVVISTMMMQHAPASTQIAFQVTTGHHDVLIGKTWTGKGSAAVSDAIV